jgi:hypothetical protein
LWWQDHLVISESFLYHSSNMSIPSRSLLCTSLKSASWE